MRTTSARTAPRVWTLRQASSAIVHLASLDAHVKPVGWYSIWYVIIRIVLRRNGIDTFTVKIPVQQNDFRILLVASLLIYAITRITS